MERRKQHRLSGKKLQTRYADVQWTKEHDGEKEKKNRRKRNENRTWDTLEQRFTYTPLLHIASFNRIRIHETVCIATHTNTMQNWK